MSGPHLIVIFGASVQRDGTPSQALMRRIASGAAAAAGRPGAPVFCSGGPTKAGVTEAAVMAEALLRLGVPGDRLILDEASLDTLQNVSAAARMAYRMGGARVIACSDGYHLPRVRLLLAALGVASEAGPTPIPPARATYRIGMAMREAVAIPYDLTLALMQRRRLVS